jgi:hypothetical protein
MRADMAKVIVERPRFGSRARGKGKGYRRRLQRLRPDELPRREGIKVCSGGTKMLNEHLGPLRRFLQSRLGRPWDKVFAEICANLSRNSAVQDHVRDHVEDYVETKVVLIDGVPCYGHGRLYGRPLTEGYYRRLPLYVCPVTGMLKRVKPRPVRPRKNKSKAVPYIWLSDDRQCRWVEGAWHLVDLKPLPLLPHLSRQHDVVLGRPVASLTAGEACKTYGAAVYAVAKRPLGKKEMRQLPIPLDWQRGV